MVGSQVFAWRLRALPALAGCALLLMLLSGCDGPFCSEPQPVLHVVGARQLSLPAPCYLDPRNRCPGVIDLIAPYVAPAHFPHAGETRLLISQDGHFYDMGLNGGGATAVNLPPPCTGALALSRDMRQLACIGESDQCVDCSTVCNICVGRVIDVAALSPGFRGEARAIAATNYANGGPDAYFGVLTWSPDGQHLAVLREQHPSGPTPICVLSLYSEIPATDTLVESGRLALAWVDACRIGQISWSPDGSSIAFVTEDAYQANGVYLLATKRLPPAALDFMADEPVTTSVTPQELFALPEWDVSDSLPAIAWTPDAQTLTVAGFGPNVIVIDKATGLARTLLTLPAGATPDDELAWLPGGAQLALSIGARSTGSCTGSTGVLYLYTAPPLDTLPIIAPSRTPQVTATIPAATVVPTATPAPTLAVPMPV